MDDRFIQESLEYIVDEIRRRKIGPKLSADLGPWISAGPVEAVEKTIRVKKELRDYLANNPTNIAVAGNIGLGKTAFTKILSEDLGIQSCFELENDLINGGLLGNFLRDKKQYCFDLQMHLLGKRLGLREEYHQSGKSFIEDRTPEEDPAVFHKLFREQGLLTEQQYQTLQVESRRAYRNSPQSDLMILLKGSPEISWRRIMQRARPEEIEGGWEYEKDIRPLARIYSNFLGVVKGYGLHKEHLLEIDVSKVDITQIAHQGFVY